MTCILSPRDRVSWKSESVTRCSWNWCTLLNSQHPLVSGFPLQPELTAAQRSSIFLGLRLQAVQPHARHLPGHNLGERNERSLEFICMNGTRSRTKSRNFEIDVLQLELRGRPTIGLVTVRILYESTGFSDSRAICTELGVHYSNPRRQLVCMSICDRVPPCHASSSLSSCSLLLTRCDALKSTFDRVEIPSIFVSTSSSSAFFLSKLFSIQIQTSQPELIDYLFIYLFINKE